MYKPLEFQGILDGIQYLDYGEIFLGNIRASPIETIVPETKPLDAISYKSTIYLQILIRMKT